ncbi:hypothetical protein SASPL_112057 [Salvia splendens]|uniref:Myb/SANT-like domain-containing protein n=1 Tax=Salvia splendens TaxID=180675 RepID=A0A8X8Y995_SALSN|nr:hypothetical protein SASPL_112057 [Salvia splendens]
MRSYDTISKYIKNVLWAVMIVHRYMLVTPQAVEEGSTDSTWKYFQGCLGALDGTYIHLQVPTVDKPRYRSRKGHIATNVLAVCDRNEWFVYVLTGWEGSAADGRVLKDAISREWFKSPNCCNNLVVLIQAGVMSSSHNNNFPRPPDLPMVPSHAPNKERRIWTIDEESALIAIMKKLVAKGYRQDHAFRSGYLEMIEKELKVWFPGTDLNFTNANSKLTVWKRQYSLVVNMINTSGFGWNDSSNMITVEDDVWKQYVKSTIDLEKVARKQQASNDFAKVASQQPYLPDSDMNEFSTGLNVHTQDDSFSNTNENVDHEFSYSSVPLEEEASDTRFPGESNSVNSTKRDGDKKTQSKRKRKQQESATSKDSVIVDLMDKFFKQQNESIGIFVDKLDKQSEQSTSSKFEVVDKTKLILEALRKIATLPKKTRLSFAYKITIDARVTDLFPNLSEGERITFVNMMMAKKVLP